MTNEKLEDATRSIAAFHAAISLTLSQISPSCRKVFLNQLRKHFGNLTPASNLSADDIAQVAEMKENIERVTNRFAR